MLIKLHKVIHCFNSSIILLYEHRIPPKFDTHRWPDMNVIEVWIYKPDSSYKHKNTSLKTKFYLI